MKHACNIISCGGFGIKKVWQLSNSWVLCCCAYILVCHCLWRTTSKQNSFTSSSGLTPKRRRFDSIYRCMGRSRLLDNRGERDHEYHDIVQTNHVHIPAVRSWFVCSFIRFLIFFVCPCPLNPKQVSRVRSFFFFSFFQWIPVHQCSMEVADPKSTRSTYDMIMWSCEVQGSGSGNRAKRYAIGLESL